MGAAKPERQSFDLYLKMWPDVSTDGVCSLAVPIRMAAFSHQGAIRKAGTVLDAAAAGLAALARSIGITLPALPLRKYVGSTDDGFTEPSSLLEATRAGQAVSLWRGKDGWLLVSLQTHDHWRTFAGAFLNLTVYRSTVALDAWRSPAVNEITTAVLDTHCVDDAAGTCLTYGVPAAAVPEWRDVETGGASRMLADRLAWAALRPCCAANTDTSSMGKDLKP